MSESAFRSRIVKVLRPLHAVAVENVVGTGTPDVNCTLGWIELKVDEALQDAEETIPLRHFTQQQKVWLYNRWAAGGVALLLVKVGSSWFLIPGNRVLEVNRPTFSVLKKLSLNWWAPPPTDKEFLDCIRSIYQSRKDSCSTVADADSASKKKPSSEG